jgi:SAM-dependent methyltransferase
MTCGICGAAARLAASQQPGYQEPGRFDIYHCEGCGTAFASPLREDPEIYGHIYRASGKVRGYDRYARYAREIVRAEDPLASLASREDVYWTVTEALRLRGLSPGSRVVDFGCGLGYLTFALRCAGYDALGLDVSDDAIEAATARFGPYYRQGGSADLVGVAGSFACVTLLETIEHVADPRALLTSAVALLQPGGFLVLTTPNKSAVSPGTAWSSDLPPVHLWWFTEAGVAELARAAGCDTQLIDFTRYTRRNPLPRDGGCFAADPGAPALSASGTPVPAGPAKRLRRTMFRLGLRPAAEFVWRTKVRWQSRGAPPVSRRPTLGAILTRRGDGL